MLHIKAILLRTSFSCQTTCPRSIMRFMCWHWITGDHRWQTGHCEWSVDHVYLQDTHTNTLVRMLCVDLVIRFEQLHTNDTEHHVITTEIYWCDENKYLEYIKHGELQCVCLKKYSKWNISQSLCTALLFMIIIGYYISSMRNGCE